MYKIKLIEFLPSRGLRQTKIFIHFDVVKQDFQIKMSFLTHETFNVFILEEVKLGKKLKKSEGKLKKVDKTPVKHHMVVKITQ